MEKFKDLPGETKIAKIVLIVFGIILCSIIVLGIADRVIDKQPKDVECDHELVTVYYNESAPAILKRCVICNEKFAELKKNFNVELTPLAKQSCNHMNYELIKEESGTDLASDGKIYTYRCNDCGSCWKILNTQTSNIVLNEWKEKETK